MKTRIIKNQIIPISLAAVVCVFFAVVLYGEIFIVNRFIATDILLSLHSVDVFLGLTIYLKTSIDFALFIGHLMHDNPGWKDRIAIEIGTAAGNALGTFVVVALWAFFKEVRWLLGLMIFVAALVLFRLAEQGLEHAEDEDDRYPKWFRQTVFWFEKGLERFNSLTEPLLRYVVPNMKASSTRRTSFWSLLAFSFTIPFILGLDDFAGYVSLFRVVNVFGFGVGVLLGHMILTMFLYLWPSRTIKAVKNPVISLLGSFAFVILGIFGFFEVFHLIF